MLGNYAETRLFPCAFGSNKKVIQRIATCRLRSAFKLLMLFIISQLGLICFMRYVSKIIFITIILSSFSPIFSAVADTQLAGAGTPCRGSACANSAPAPKTIKDTLSDFSLSPTQLLLGGLALLAIRIVVKKVLPPKG